jgi:ribosomal protein S16
MNLVLKLKKEGQLKKHLYSIIVLEKKKNIYSKYKDKIGNYLYLDNNAYLYINKKKLLYWLKLGVKINKKISKLIKI